MLRFTTSLHRGLDGSQAGALKHSHQRPTTISKNNNNKNRPALTVQAQRGSETLPETYEFINAARSKIGSQGGAATFQKPGSIDPNADLITKIKAAWRIFFPEKPSPLTPKEEGKKRLRMILVADRCGMSPDSLRGMRESIVKAMSDFVEVEAEEAVEVNMSMDPEIGTIYSVAVPVRRVKPSLRPGMAEDDESIGGQGVWDPTDPNSDPSDQFPYGT